MPPSSRADINDLWLQLQQEAFETQARETVLADFIQTFILNHTSFLNALSYMLAEGLAHSPVDPARLRHIIVESLTTDPSIVTAAQWDLAAIMERDPASVSLMVPFLFFKGFHALQAHRVAHWLWRQNRKIMALYLQSRISRFFAVDIHPAAIIGKGIMMDHAHGIVIGETAVIEDNVSLLHNVTLGGTGKTTGDRHPKIRSGVMIGAGAKILGNIEVGESARIAAGSVVLQNVPPHTTVAGVPAKIVGGAGCESPAQEMDQMLTSQGDSI